MWINLVIKRNWLHSGRQATLCGWVTNYVLYAGFMPSSEIRWFFQWYDSSKSGTQYGVIFIATVWFEAPKLKKKSRAHGGWRSIDNTVIDSWKHRVGRMADFTPLLASLVFDMSWKSNVAFLLDWAQMVHIFRFWIFFHQNISIKKASCKYQGCPLLLKSGKLWLSSYIHL